MVGATHWGDSAGSLVASGLLPALLCHCSRAKAGGPGICPEDGDPSPASARECCYPNRAAGSGDPSGFGSSGAPTQCPSHGRAQDVLGTGEGIEPGDGPVPRGPVPLAARGPFKPPPSLLRARSSRPRPSLAPPLSGPLPLSPLDAAAALPAPPRQRFLSGRHCRGGR